jgi:hypothetical protein
MTRKALTRKEDIARNLEWLKWEARNIDITRKPKYADGVRPSGRILVHNHIRRTATMPPGLNGFRIWYDFLKYPQHFKNLWDTKPTKYVVCKCGWRPDFGKHYRLKGMGSPNYRVDTPETVSKF